MPSGILCTMHAKPVLKSRKAYKIKNIKNKKGYKKENVHKIGEVLEMAFRVLDVLVDFVEDQREHPDPQDNLSRVVRVVHVF
jgi:hypothetical protein